MNNGVARLRFCLLGSRPAIAGRSDSAVETSLGLATARIRSR